MNRPSFGLRADPRASTLASLVLLIALGTACGPKRSETPTRPKPEQLRPPSALPYDFMWRQRVHAEWPTGKESFEAVLQKRDGELTMVGLSALGQPGFALTLREDGSLGVQNRTGRELPFEPSYIMADVERVFFPWLEPVAPGYSGERSGRVRGFIVSERFANGRLLSREFERSAQDSEGKVRIDYRYAGTGDAPLQVKLDNGFYRYQLTIETFEQSRL